MIDNQQNIFIGGVDRDTDYRAVRNDRLVGALNANFMSDEEGRVASVEPLHSSLSAFSVPSVGEENVVFRATYESLAEHVLQLVNIDTGLPILTTPPTLGANIGAVLSTMNTFLNIYGYNLLNLSTSGSFSAVEVENNTGTFLNIRPVWVINGGDDVAIILQYAYEDNNLTPISSYNIDNLSFLLSTDPSSQVGEIGIADKTGGVWTYTRILRSPFWQFPLNKTVSIRVEAANDNKWAIYLTYDGGVPFVLYVQQSYSEDCVVSYTVSSFVTPPAGSYIVYGYEKQQTKLQLINNAGVVTYSSQLQNGGGLVSGGYRYSIRFGVNGTGNTTEWSVATPNVIPVFKSSIDSASSYIRIQGDKPGEPTGKANVLLVENASVNLFNFVELACIYSAGDSTSAYIVGKFDVTSDSFEITHTGTEQGTTTLDIGDIPSAEPVFLSATSLEIKKNRLNLANVEVASDDSSIAAIAAAVSIAQGKKLIDGVGRLTIASSGGAIYATPGNTTWGINSSTAQSATNQVQIFTNVPTPVSGYDAGTGRFTASSTGVYKISCGIGFDGSATLLSQSKISLLKDVSGVITEITFLEINRDGDGRSFEISVNLTSGDVLYLAATYNFSTTSNFSYGAGSGWSIATVSTSSTDFKDTRVGEYQLPENCAKYVGYTLNEKYPIFMRTHHESGYISSPFYCGLFDNAYDNTVNIFTSGTTYSNYQAISYFAEISGINISALRSLSDPVIGISFWRGVCNPTVLGTGVVMPADTLGAGKYTAGFYSSIPTSNGAYGVAFASNNDNRKFAMFFSHDTRLSKTEPVAGDVIKHFQCPLVLTNQSGIASVNVPNALGSFAEFYGQVNLSGEYDVTVTDGVYTDFDKAVSDVNDAQPQLVSGSLLNAPNVNIRNKASGSMENVSVAVDTWIAPTALSGIDNGLYMAQYIRTVSNQYDIKTVKIVPTGTYVKIDRNTPATLNGVQVFGGDAYTQKNILKVRYWSQFDTNNIRTSFITYYGQNKINTQLFFCDTKQLKTTFNLQGHESIYNYLFPFNTVDDVVEEQFNYDNGYSAEYPFGLIAYNSRLPQRGRYGSRIYYSQQKPIDSVQDFYRKIKPLDYKDLDPKDGDISAIYDVNDTMMSFQPRAVSNLPYLSDVALSAEDGSLYVGNGGVYSQRESKIGAFGPENLSQICLGRNKNGNINIYWLSAVYKKLCRYSYDGMKVLSDDNYFRAFFINNVPSDVTDCDVQMGFDINTQTLFTSIREEGWTVMFNEKMNAFTDAFSVKPFRMFMFQDTLLAPDAYPTLTSNVHELFGGTEYLVWFEFSDNEVIGTFDLEYVINKQPFASKRAIAIAINVGESHGTGANPTMTATTALQSSTVNPIDWQLRRGELVVAFRNDSGDAPLVGQWVKVKLSSSQFYRIFASIARFRYMHRLAVK